MPQAPASPAKIQVSSFTWGDADLRLQFRVGSDGVVRLAALGSAADLATIADEACTDIDGDLTGPLFLPLVEVLVTGSGRNRSGERSIHTAAGSRLLYQGHEESRDGVWSQLRVDLADPDSGLAAQILLRSPDGVGAVQSTVRIANRGVRRLVLESVTSFVISGLVNEATEADEAGEGHDHLAGLDVLWADNDWLAEGRWQRVSLREALVDVDRARHYQDPRSSFQRTSQGSWSTGRHLPMGALVARGGGRVLAWQVESSAGWRWEIGEHSSTAYLALLGPTDCDHQWRQVLEPGDEFTTVPAAVAFGAAPFGSDDDALAAAISELTNYRRALRRPHPEQATLPVIFNDYMNTLMGDPTADKLAPLIDAAAGVGAEVFVIDAGWYDDDAAGWWDSVGEWQESRSRFPDGMAKTTDRIRAAGMVPGLWLEPEVVGLRSPVAARLPEAAFFQRDGIRVVEHGRYQLDLRHPAAVRHLDQVVDRLVADYGVGYFKLDYNINPGPGTDLGGSAGSGLLGHQRAYLAWLDAVLDRHPGLILENCSSGGMRTDYALLARLQLQSTSDQQDPLRYPPIAAAAPAAMLPEQAAVWAYPQPGYDADLNAFTLASALLGRVHLSGYLNRMSAEQRALVAEAVAVYKLIRADIPRSVPFWPLGLPGWTGPWVALGQRAPFATYLTAWRRIGESDSEQTLGVPHLRGHDVTPRTLFPAATATDADLSWDPDRGELTVRLPRPGTARLISLTHRDLGCADAG
ncbi:glycoside hydrolase family 36 protein [Actinocrinis sp.]|uniref:glycoside hydrolase family 36 protein n=1 Tax=Actinocrinis sp. TaxID=1920516 RepID=UPI002D61396F|nr:glycoside hydrolase family 36 protein [Actinocrinis sp.]HZP52728.1 glycoside hydrolase family 36 protein [Actinocrinis sp.]